jgi:Fe-S-cluster containining protein
VVEDSPLPVTFAIQLQTATGPLRGRVQVDPGPMRLAELIPIACELTDRLVNQALLKEEREGRHVSCRPACGACCRQMVPLSPPEAFYLVDLVASVAPQRRVVLEGRFEAIVTELERRAMIGPLLEPAYTDEPALAIAQQYFRLQHPCPFLEEESCVIHPVRPVGCRDYNVTSPSDWCSDPYTKPIQRVPMPLPLSAPLARLTADLTGARARLIPLALALRWAAEHNELGSRTWPGLDLFRGFVDQMAGAAERVSSPAQGSPQD